MLLIGYTTLPETFPVLEPPNRPETPALPPLPWPDRSLLPETPLPPRPPAQPICCCGRRGAAVAGLCLPCYRQRRYSALFFGGNRDLALERDGRACRGCQTQHYLNVHHRRRGDHTQLVTLCAGCHAPVHR